MHLDTIHVRITDMPELKSLIAGFRAEIEDVYAENTRLRAAAQSVSECWGKSYEDYYRLDMEEAMKALNAALIAGTADHV